VFPAQWLKFLGIREPLCEEFLKHHAEILTADWWRRLKANHEDEKLVEVIPYTARTSRHAVISG
ncbi:MAG: bifunctional isocitrate dehydrogenase kinase/phosphatase, partial [Gammaproteobacteria bacterium]|nr:bifunctional isocitrate dehydrogenase kinase/phosphatase [Gammaproteobacteria bacterium]